MGAESSGLGLGQSLLPVVNMEDAAKCIHPPPARSFSMQFMFLFWRIAHGCL